MTVNQKRQLEEYHGLVQRYSKTLDLSSPKKLQAFSIAIENSKIYAEIVPESAKVLDIGSGVGIPGIPLAILRPDTEVTLCEIRQKRAAFLERVVSSIHISNAHVYNGDVQQIRDQKFTTVTAQAVGSFKHLYQLCSHVLDSTWVIISNKGETIQQEMEELGKITQIRSHTIKNLDENASIVSIYGGQK